MKGRPYGKPVIETTRTFETSALACAKTPDPPPGSYHMPPGGPYVTGHFGPGFGGDESLSGSAGTGWPPGSTSYPYSGLCLTWVTYSS
jgi:hypothetical protein